MNIFDIITNPDNLVKCDARQPFPHDLFNRYIRDNREEYFLVVSNYCLCDSGGIKQLFSKYYISEIFDIGNLFLNTGNLPYMLWHITKQKPEKVKVSVFFETAHPYRDNDYHKILSAKDFSIKLSDKYNDIYIYYLWLLERWMLKDVLPDESKHYYWECREISVFDFDTLRPLPLFHRKSSDELRKLLQKQEFVQLNTLADIYHVLPGENKKVKVINDPANIKYPFYPSLNCSETYGSNYILKKGDILVFNKNYILVDKEIPFNLYAMIGATIIKAKSVCPEFLYLYLTSETSKKIQNCFKVPMGDVMGGFYFDGGSLERLIVVKPKNNDDYYIEKFNKIVHPTIKYYNDVDEIHSINYEDVLSNEISEKIRNNGNELLIKAIGEDIDELNTCYKSGAYKATLILAGSIMEAFLIDWLSEIKKINYFKKNLCKRKYNKDTKCYEKNEKGEFIYTQFRADLSDYIEEIKDIKKPHWMDESVKAHEIRNKRNLVHAKLCLKEDVLIDEQTCRQVVDYLEIIIQSRWNEE